MSLDDLILEAYGLGMLPEDLWGITLAELYKIIEERNRHTINTAIINAWYDAAFRGEKNLPKLENCLSNRKKERKLTLEEARAEKQRLKEVFGLG